MRRGQHRKGRRNGSTILCSRCLHLINLDRLPAETGIQLLRQTKTVDYEAHAASASAFQRPLLPFGDLVRFAAPACVPDAVGALVTETLPTTDIG
jgi:hypothetical protein